MFGIYTSPRLSVKATEIHFCRRGFGKVLTERVERGFSAARDHINTRRMRTDEESALVARIQSQSPNTHARQTQFTQVDTRPGLTRIRRTIDAATRGAILISVTGEDLVGVAWVNQNAREVSERKITATA